jgi:hypothetical protein
MQIPLDATEDTLRNAAIAMEPVDAVRSSESERFARGSTVKLVAEDAESSPLEAVEQKTGVMTPYRAPSSSSVHPAQRYECRPYRDTLDLSDSTM